MSLRDRGYMGRILHVDLTRSTFWEEELKEEIARALIGGKGVATYLLLRETKAGVDPLGPDNVLIFGTGPLNGALTPTSGKFAVVTKSPATGAYLDSYCGGPFGLQLKLAGYDFLIVRGKASRPTVITIDNGQVVLHPAGDLWGTLTTEATERLKEMYGEDTASAVIGPAGERLSPVAGILSDLRIAARGGVGAVMGSKLLKAVVARGSGEVRVADPEKLQKAAWTAFRSLRMSSAVQRLTKNGSANIVELINASGGLPTRNFQKGQFASVRELYGETWRKKAWIGDTACFGCPIACSKIGLVQKGKYKGTRVDGAEYETVYSLGTQCENSDRDAIMAANHVCDIYGIDSISTGAIIGFVMELYEKGMVTAADLDGIEARWGDGEAVVALTEKIATGEGIGAILEKGVRRLAEEHYPQAKDFAMHVKGLEMPAYLPRAAKGIALAYAISERGACHLHGAPIGELLGDAEPLTYDGKAQLVRSKQLDVAVVDSTVHCYFTDFGMTLKEVYFMLAAATGFEYAGLPELEKIAERIINLTRLFNLREGFTHKDDTLPARCLYEPLPDGPAAGETVNLERLLKEYYHVMGWDESGRPTRKKLAELGLLEGEMKSLLETVA